MEKQSTLDKIRGLLTKARNTPYPEEASAFFNKATQLMARYSITESMLAEKRPDFVTKTEISLGKYRTHKESLVVATAQAFGCHVVKPDHGILALIGFETDLEMLENLLKSLLLQLDSELLNVSGYNTRTARVNFAYAWCDRVSARITSFYTEAIREYEKTTGNSTALVLVNKEEQVASWAERFYGYRPRYSTRHHRFNPDSNARSAGAAAGDRADIGQPRFEKSHAELSA